MGIYSIKFIVLGLVTRNCLEFNGKDEGTDCENIFENCEKFTITDYCVASNEE